MNRIVRLVTGLVATVMLSGVVVTSAPTPAAASHREKARNDARHARMDAQRARELWREGNYAKARSKWRAARKRQRMAERERYRANH